MRGAALDSSVYNDKEQTVIMSAEQRAERKEKAAKVAGASTSKKSKGATHEMIADAGE